ncbi:unnamed protein product [Closterium sp. NIES-64]|nr:unnamed protein product [Closterium sp. NIES-64]
METATHINDLPDDIIAKILWHCEESTPWKSDSDALWSRHSLYEKPLYLRSIVLDKDPSPEEEDSYPVSYPSAIPTAAKIFLVSSVCRRWRDVAQRNISTLLVERKQAIPLQELSNAVACFPNLTHLHLCDDSVETLDDSFLAHLASSCPQLKILHVGRSITHHPDYVGPKHKHPITEAGLDRFFQRCTQLEQLSLLCLHWNTELPASFFRLTRLHTLALTAASALEAPDLESLASLTTLHIAFPEVTEEQLANVRRLPSITGLSLSPGTSFSPHGSAAFAIAQLPLIKSLSSRHVLLSDWPLTSLERLQISDCENLKRLPARIAELLPSLRELTVSRCHALEELPEGACSLKHLETLSLIKCDKFRCLPENVGRLSALSTLVLDLLPLLASLPASICQLSSLETFFLLSCDSIRELPAGFGRLTALTTLCLERVALPADIGRLSNLHTLLVTRSFGYPHLPCSLSSLSETSSLTRLELNRCGVELLPEGVGSLSSLRELHVSSCPRLAALPASVTSLTALEALSLADCHNLTSAPTRLDGLTRLKRLEVARCDRLTRPPLVLPASIEWLGWGGFRHAWPLPDVSTLTGLRTLRLDVVAVACGVAVSRSLSHLEHLQLTLANDAEELPFALTFLSCLRTLIIDYAINLQRLPADIGSALPQLRKLKLVSAYELGELPASVTALQNLTSLTACNAPLASLPDGIGALSRLRELDLYNSDDLEQLPASLTHLTRLNHLSITTCPIRSLCPTVSQFSRLRSLNLSGCAQLEALPGDLSALTALRSLDVEECGHVTDTDGAITRKAGNDHNLKRYGTWSGWQQRGGTAKKRGVGLCASSSSHPRPCAPMSPRPCAPMSPRPCAPMSPRPCAPMSPVPVPYVSPSLCPYVSPSLCPYVSPSLCPYVSPSLCPYVSPSLCPYVSPSLCPYVSPSLCPYVSPSLCPYVSPSLCPYVSPSLCPYVSPSLCPYVSPSLCPYVSPSLCPYVSPSLCPYVSPSLCPYVSPSLCPYVSPSLCPYVSPSLCPYVSPSLCPYVSPSLCPYVSPSLCPYVSPSLCPYVSPSLCPYVSPSLCPYVSRPLCPYVSPSLCPYVSPSLCPYVSPSLCPYVSPYLERVAAAVKAAKKRVPGSSLKGMFFIPPRHPTAPAPARRLAGVTGWLALCLTPPPLPLCTPLPGASQVSLGGWAAVPAATPAPRVPYPLSPLHTRPRQAPPRCRWWRTQQVHSPPLSYSHLPSRLSRLHFPPRRLPGVAGGALSRRVAGPLPDCLHAEYGHADVALLLSLGSPHLPPPPGAEGVVDQTRGLLTHMQAVSPGRVQGVVDQTRGLLTHMQAVSPGAFHAPHVKYVCISSRYDTVAYVHMPVSHAGEAFSARQPAFPFPITSSPQPHPPTHAAVAAAAAAAAAGGEARVFALDVKPVGVGGAASQAAGGSDAKPESESEGEREEGSSGASDEKNQEATAGRQVQVASGGGVFQARMVGQGYKQVCGRAEVWGDRVVPEDAALLEGAENLILDGVYHSPVGASEARPWYGSPSVLPSWQHHLLV